MAITNHDRVTKALDLLKKGLLPFVEREMKAVHGKRWEELAESYFSMDRVMKAEKKEEWDSQKLLSMIWDYWNDVFKRTLGHSERSLVSELRETRNKWAHQQTFSTDDTYRALDSIGRLLNAVSAGEEATEIEKQKQELLRLRFDEQRRSEDRKAAFAPVEGKPAGNLKPWRDVVTPHPDVASGRYQQAEFAADLWQVYLKEGSDEYRDPVEFFRRTFLTEGLTQLLNRAILRMTEKGGDPVVELQTNFGGGKTHSMLALYHLFSGVRPTTLPGVDGILKQIGGTFPDSVHRAVLVGTKISPGQPHKKPDGTVVHTLWGEIAWQLGKKEGYALLQKPDETATNPGDLLRDLFNRYSPCLILIDEWVAYARQLHEDSSLPAGTFDTQFTFAQAISEAARAAKAALLVVSIPASESPHQRGGEVSEIEIGGERGHLALQRLKNAIGRIEASWRPASQDEGFEIVRRRLFQPITDKNHFIAKDQTARAFTDFYRSQQQEFPSDCREASYERRIQAAYPIHPELFDRLYSDWSTLDKFQRTRGVLRLMAAVIHSLWEREDKNLLIMPSTIPMDDVRVSNEMTRYLEEQWSPVIEKDVDGPYSLPLVLDRENPNLGRYSSCRRVARTIYMGSAPVQHAANRGIDELHVKLGCAQPGETVATFGDAIRRLNDRATYLYFDGTRYWYSTQPTVTRLATDRAGQYSDADVVDEIKRRLRQAANTRGEFSKVHSCAPSGDIPDEQETRLVILSSEYPHTSKDLQSAATTEANRILNSRGNSPRTYRNTLVFIAADANRLRELEQSVRQYLAWSSIYNERDSLNLDPFSSKQVDTRRKAAEETVDLRIPETYQWLLVPTQPDPKGPIQLNENRIAGQDAPAIKASKKLKGDQLLYADMGGALLRYELDRIPLWRGNHVSIKQLAEDMATYVYLPRLKEPQVLVSAIEEGLGLITWEKDTFAYAEQWDETRARYVGLRSGKNVRVTVDGRSLLVQPSIAAKQMAEEEKESTSATESVTSAAATTVPIAPGESKAAAPAAPATYRRYYGNVKLDPLRMGRDAGRIAEEIVQHLSAQPESKVEVTLEIRAEIPNGASEKTVRDVNENSRTLKFDSYGFEEE
ncbi:DUF499 domain-containing protein [bacterium]|nr:DUF499 domain-containing protein [bacterium]